jgi:hypothetical protein
MAMMKNLDMLNKKYHALKSRIVHSPIKVKHVGSPPILRKVPSIEKVSKTSQGKMVPIVKETANKSQLQKKPSSNNNVKKNGQKKEGS